MLWLLNYAIFDPQMKPVKQIAHTEASWVTLSGLKAPDRVAMLRLFAFLMGSILFFGCQNRTQPGQENSFRVTDDFGREIVLPAPPQRVMGLAPSITEMLAVLVPDSQIVGRTQHCNFPDWVQKKPVVNTYPFDIERLLQLKPDLVITVEGMTSLETAEKLQQVGIPVYYQKYRMVDDIFKGMLDIGRIMELPETAGKVVDSLRQQMAAMQPDKQRETPPKVIALAWQDPIMVYGRNTLFTDKVRLAGGENAVDIAIDNPYPPVSREYLLKQNPDVIISRDYSFEAMDTTFFNRYPELRTLKAYRNKRIFAVDPDLMERPNPRVLQSVREIQALLP